MGQRHEPALDGLRGIAAVAVMLYHVNFHYFRVLPGGYVGVDIFFVLSGYLITRILISEVNLTGSINLLAFFGRRAARLLPALLVMTLIIVAAYHWLLPRWDHLVWIQAAMAATYMMDFGLLIPSREGPLLHTWSLAVEAQFYLVWPLAVMLLTKLRPVIAAGIMLASWLAITLLRDFAFAQHSSLLAYYTPLHATGLELGAALAFLPRLRVWSSTAIAIVAVLIWLPSNDFTQYWAITAAEIVAALAITAPARLLSMRPLRWTGKISYSLYLWHLPIWFLASTLRVPHAVAFTVTTSFTCAAASYYGIERHVIAWARSPRRASMVRLSQTRQAAS